jgi:tRNA-dihydrouridine synthase B
VKTALTIPVIANGDITDAGSARQALRLSGADGVMVGRGAQGRPWALAEIAHGVFGTPAPEIPTGAALADLVWRHITGCCPSTARSWGAVARKHLGWYLETAGATPMRGAILTEDQPGRVLSLIRVAAFADAPRPVQARGCRMKGFRAPYPVPG